jgi:hypothetical protein
LSRILFNMQANSSANVFATSRHIQDIEKEFEGRSVRLEIGAKNEDVEKYLDDHMSELRLLNEKNQDLSKEKKGKFKSEIKTNIIKIVNGM